MILSVAVLSARAQPAAQSLSTVPKKAKSPMKFGATVGVGTDSNVYSRTDKSSQATLGEAIVQAQHTIAPAADLSVVSGLALGGSYRAADEAATKISANLNSNMSYLLFGKKKLPGGKKVKAVYPVAKFSLGLKYAFSANPAIADFQYADEPPEEPDPDAEDEPIDVDEDLFYDPEVGELLETDDADSFDLGMDDFADDDFEDEESFVEGEWEEESDEEDAGDFLEDNALVGKSFGLENARHNVGAALGFGLEFTRGTSLSLRGTAGRSFVGVDEGKPSANSNSFNTGLCLNQQLIKKVKLSGGYSLGWQMFDEKTSKSGEDLAFMNHGPAVAVSVTPIKILKFKGGYAYKMRDAQVEDPIDTYQHQMRLDVTVAVLKQLALTGQSIYALSGLTDNDSKDAERLQALLGLKLNM